MIESRETSSRREWFRGLGRLLGFGVLGGGVIVMGSRTLRKQDAECALLPLCDGCHILSDCSLPQANEARQETQEEHHG